MNELPFPIDRDSAVPLPTQIYLGLTASIANGGLPVGARLPSWRDLAIQLGVARGTVQEAYGRMAAEQLVEARGAAGTYVVALPARPGGAPSAPERRPLPDLFAPFGASPRPFQLGAPTSEALPLKLFSRLLVQAAKRHAVQAASRRDPRGEIELRTAIASMLVASRGFSCTPAQVIVTSGYASALSLVCGALELRGARVWTEDPAYPLTRHALALAGLEPTPAPVDDDGFDIEAARRLAPDARLAVVTPSQQAPLGMTLSRERRRGLLSWAQEAGGWILEDDYLGELQLHRRAAPALAASDIAGRVILAGTFSKTMSPALRVGFLVAPRALMEALGAACACMAPASGPVEQSATAAFLAEGHYFRHIRRLKLLYARKQAALVAALNPLVGSSVRLRAEGGLTVRLELPAGVDDLAIARAAAERGLAPAALSTWSAGGARRGLLLGIASLQLERLEADSAIVAELVQQAIRHGP